MDPQNAGPAPTSELTNENGEHDHYLTVTGRPSAASSLRRVFAESTSTPSGLRTPDERTALLEDPPHDQEDTGGAKRLDQGVWLSTFA